jgi:hypothetical protein|tara:strand:- start:433 stop:918 length:486 start_codon:yes stop_codon:yes gene_type:complete
MTPQDTYTSTDCFDSLSKGSPYVSQEECDNMLNQENGCGPGTHYKPPIGGVCPQCITAPCPCGSCENNNPLGEELSESEQFCQDKTNSMSWADVVPNPDKEDFYASCVDEQNALIQPEGLIEGTEIETKTAGFGDDKMLLWLLLAGGALWYLNTKGFFQKL